MPSGCAREGSSWILGKLQNSGEALEWAAWGGGAVIVPGGVQEKDRCCTQWHGLEWSQA